MPAGESGKAQLSDRIEKLTIRQGQGQMRVPIYNVSQTFMKISKFLWADVIAVLGVKGGVPRCRKPAINSSYSARGGIGWNW